MAFLTDFPADLDRREAEQSGECRCGQDECLPARQLNREVEIHKARPKRPHLYHIREYALHCDMEALRVHARCWARITDALFGGGR